MKDARAGLRVEARRQPRGRIAQTLVLALLVGLLAWFAGRSLPGRIAEAKYFDLLVTALPAPPDLGQDIVIVAIDEPSFAELGLQWPWPRRLHAELVERLRAAGARAIGLDIVFAEPSNAADDAALAGALGSDVLLAADESLIETPQASQFLRTEPAASLLEKGPRIGVASLAIDADNVLRRIPSSLDGFGARLAEMAGAPAGTIAPGLGQMLRPVGPARTYRTVSYYQALDPETFLPPGLFDGRIVLVGRSLQMPVSAAVGSADSFATPFTARTGLLVPGVEIQAAIADNLRHGLAIRPAPETAVALLLATALGLAALLGLRPASLATLLLGLGLVGLVFAASAVALHGFQLFLQPLMPAAAIPALLVPLGVRDIAEERRRRRAVTRAFGHYLAPAMVERLARDPAALRLGGERRELTILFADVRNFTPLTESMKDEPERLTQLVNRLLTPLSQAVLDRGGTIDKFIGDCIMAFWNAPLDDPRHAVHAVEAGLAMLAAVERLNADLAAELGGTPPHLAIGVGINTGTCVVGNMGSQTRFDYSVLGDAVNYASRLEGASKTVGVSLLLGAATAEAIAEDFEPRLVDHIAVKGRSGTAPVYTVLPLP